MHVQNVDTLRFPTVQTDWKNSRVAPSYPPSTSGNSVLEKRFFVIFLTNLQTMTVRPLQMYGGLPGMLMHIQNVDTVGFPTVQTDWKNSKVAPSYPRGTSGNPVLKKRFFVIFLTNLQTMTIPPLQAYGRLPSTLMHIQNVDTLVSPTVVNGLEKLHGGAKLPPRYLWQPGSEKKIYHFFDQPLTHNGPTAQSWCATAWQIYAF